MKKRGRKGQAWGIDLGVAFIIFFAGVVVFYFYALNQPNETEDLREILSYEGNSIASSILSEGYPKDWNSNNVVTIGILSENKINETKLGRFYNLSLYEYAKTQNIFNTRFKYYYSLDKNMSIEGKELEGIGAKPANTKNLIKITRFSIYQNKPTTAYVYIWE